MKSITFAVPFLNEEQNLSQMPDRVRAIVRALPQFKVRFCFIDDGSRDRSLGTLMKADFTGTETQVIKFSRNFGSHYAVLAALENCGSDYFTLMGADFQEPIELYVKMAAELEKGAVQMCFGQRLNRNAPLLDRFFSAVYNLVTRWFVFEGFPGAGVDIFMIGKKVIQVMQGLDEKNTSVYGLLFSIGFSKAFIPYRQEKRQSGKSKWTLSKKIKLLTDTFVCFSLFPLRMISLIGAGVSLLGMAFGVMTVMFYFQGKISVLGFSSIISVMTFGFGFVFLMIGVIAEYLWRMFDQVRPRPRFVVEETFELGK